MKLYKIKVGWSSTRLKLDDDDGDGWYKIKVGWSSKRLKSDEAL